MGQLFWRLFWLWVDVVGGPWGWEKFPARSRRASAREYGVWGGYLVGYARGRGNTTGTMCSAGKALCAGRSVHWRTREGGRGASGGWGCGGLGGAARGFGIIARMGLGWTIEPRVGLGYWGRDGQAWASLGGRGRRGGRSLANREPMGLYVLTGWWGVKRGKA